MSEEKVVKKVRVDWDACHRDYRTGKFTQRELAAKYGVTHGAVGKKIRDLSWLKDLTEEIRQATNARLTQELVASEVASGVNLVASGSQKVANTVSIAAEMNVQVIKGQHKRLEELDDLFKAGLRTTRDMLDNASDARESQAAVQSMSNMIGTGKTLTEMENKIFKLDAEESKENDSIELLILEAINAKASA